MNVLYLLFELLLHYFLYQFQNLVNHLSFSFFLIFFINNFFNTFTWRTCCTGKSNEVRNSVLQRLQGIYPNDWRWWRTVCGIVHAGRSCCSEIGSDVLGSVFWQIIGGANMPLHLNSITNDTQKAEPLAWILQKGMDDCDSVFITEDQKYFHIPKLTRCIRHSFQPLFCLLWNVQ